MTSPGTSQELWPGPGVATPLRLPRPLPRFPRWRFAPALSAMFAAPVAGICSGTGQPRQIEVLALGHDAIEHGQEVQSLLGGHSATRAPVVEVLGRELLLVGRELSRCRRQTTQSVAQIADDFQVVPHAGTFRRFV